MEIIKSSELGHLFIKAKWKKVQDFIYGPLKEAYPHIDSARIYSFFSDIVDLYSIGLEYQYTFEINELRFGHELYHELSSRSSTLLKSLYFHANSLVNQVLKEVFQFNGTISLNRFLAKERVEKPFELASLLPIYTVIIYRNKLLAHHDELRMISGITSANGVYRYNPTSLELTNEDIVVLDDLKASYLNDFDELKSIDNYWEILHFLYMNIPISSSPFKLGIVKINPDRNTINSLIERTGCKSHCVDEIITALEYFILSIPVADISLPKEYKKDKVIDSCAYPHREIDHERAYLNSFASNMRDIADDDYIDARTLYRNGRYRGFIYHSVQAVEKYLKCILLYIAVKVPRTHDLEVLYEEVAKNSSIELTEKSLAFLKEINGLEEAVRYDHVPYYYRYELLHELDYFVRDIRPYCKGRCVPDKIFDEGKQEGFLNLRSGHEFSGPRIFIDGKLEKLIKSKKEKEKQSRASLIWNNPWFYKVKRNHFKRMVGSYSRNLSPLTPKGPNSLKYFYYLNRYFPFHRDVVNYFTKGK